VLSAPPPSTLLVILAKEVALGDILIGIGGCRALASTVIR